ncbi:MULTISPECIES: hypothetical protein [Clostridia]|uniref:hypothetical protein n=1 Tax=Clostridia TaxID=186801 RepID=UPI000E469FE6|nr:MULTISPECIES: hypothetical protein [Clostridia]RHV71002.1 hypothetical protein DXB15_03590 [Roseburia sp. OM02-15]
MKRKTRKILYLMLLLCCMIGLCGCSSCGKNEKKSSDGSSVSEVEKNGFVFNDENLTINDKYKGYFQNGGYIEINSKHDILQIDQFTSNTNNVEYFVQDNDALCMYSFIAGKTEDVNMGTDKESVIAALSKYKEIDIDTSSESEYENDNGVWYRYITKDVSTKQFDQNFDFETFLHFDKEKDMVYIVMIVKDAETTDDYLDILDTLILNDKAYSVYKNEEFFQKVSDSSYQFTINDYDCTISKDVVYNINGYQNMGEYETIYYDQYGINIIPSKEKIDIKERVSWITDEYSDYKEDSFVNKDGYKVNYISLTLDSDKDLIRHYALASIDTGHGYVVLDIMGYNGELDLESVCSGYDIRD